MAEINIEKYAGKMNRVGYDAFLQGMRFARGEKNRNVEVCHWLFHVIANQNSDISVTLNELKLDRGRALKDLDKAMAALDKNVTRHFGITVIGAEPFLDLRQPVLWRGANPHGPCAGGAAE
jgi:type VI secretion system protein VasG